MLKRMMVFDHRHCRWLPWHGTRAAWLKLPHAAATGVCLLGTAMLQAAAPLPAVPAHPVAAHVARVPAPITIPATTIVPSGPGFTKAVPAENTDGALPEFQPTVWPAENGDGADGAGLPSLQMIALPAVRGISSGHGTYPFDDTGRGSLPMVLTTGGNPSPPTPAPEPASATVLFAALGLLTALRGRSPARCRAGPEPMRGSVATGAAQPLAREEVGNNAAIERRREL